MPVPVSDCTAGEFDALLVNDKDADAAPVDCGAKVTVKEADCPAAMVTGSEIPETANSALFSDAAVTVTEAPLAVRLPLSEALLPTTTFPNASDVGDTARVPVLVPVPESAIVRGELAALEAIVSGPLETPIAVGVKITVNVML